MLKLIYIGLVYTIYTLVAILLSIMVVLWDFRKIKETKDLFEEFWFEAKMSVKEQADHDHTGPL